MRRLNTIGGSTMRMILLSALVFLAIRPAMANTVEYEAKGLLNVYPRVNTTYPGGIISGATADCKVVFDPDQFDFKDSVTHQPIAYQDPYGGFIYFNYSGTFSCSFSSYTADGQLISSPTYVNNSGIYIDVRSAQAPVYGTEVWMGTVGDNGTFNVQIDRTGNGISQPAPGLKEAINEMRLANNTFVSFGGSGWGYAYQLYGQRWPVDIDWSNSVFVSPPELSMAVNTSYWAVNQNNHVVRPLTLKWNGTGYTLQEKILGSAQGWSSPMKYYNYNPITGESSIDIVPQTDNKVYRLVKPQ